MEALGALLPALALQPLARPRGKGRVRVQVHAKNLLRPNALGLRESIVRVELAVRERLQGYEIILMGRDAPRGQHYIVFQLEQLDAPFVDEAYRAIVRGAAAVWEFSPAHVVAWQSSGVPTCVYVPLWSTLPKSLAVVDEATSTPADGSEPIDVLLFGSMNERREALGAVLRARGLRVVFKRFEDELEQKRCIAAAAIVANVHYYATASLEVHRINPLLAAGKCVVSERGSDPALDDAYDGVVEFADSYEAFAVRVAGLLGSAARREQLCRAGRAFVRAKHAAYPAELHAAIEQLPVLPVPPGEPEADTSAGGVAVTCPAAGEADWQAWASPEPSQSDVGKAALDVLLRWSSSTK